MNPVERQTLRAQRSRRIAASVWLAAALGAVAGFSGCQAPAGATPFAYGSAPACSQVVAEPNRPISLRDSLDPLRQAFDASSEVPRIVALMPHMGCERGAEILRREVLSMHPGQDLALFVIWQDEARTGGADAAARASGYLRDPRVTAFHDSSGIAGRAFACGNLPVAEAREVFLFYPAGLTWPEEGTRPMNARPVAAQRPPKTENWVHQLGRVAPERFCTPEELPLAIRATVARLLEDAEIRRQKIQMQSGGQGSTAGSLASGVSPATRRL